MNAVGKSLGVHFVSCFMVIMFLQDDVSLVNHWLMNGKHYAQTRYGVKYS